MIVEIFRRGDPPRQYADGAVKPIVVRIETADEPLDEIVFVTAEAGDFWIRATVPHIVGGDWRGELQGLFGAILAVAVEHAAEIRDALAEEKR